MPRRRIGIRISPREVLLLIRQHYIFTSREEFPTDMECDSGAYDFDTNKFCIKVVSSTFNEVPEAQLMPYLDIEKR